MNEWWEALSLLEQIFFIIALPSTLIIIIQTVMLIFGGSFGDGTEADADLSGLDGDIPDIPDIPDITGPGELPDPAALSTADIDISKPGNMSGSDADGLRLFSVRGIMSFFTVFGWSGVILLATKIPSLISVIIAFALGVAALYLMALLFKNLMKLQESGTMNYRSVIGKTAQVYLNIPPAGQGHGKINVIVGETMREFNAVSKSDETIPTGSSVLVTGFNGDTYTVRKE